MEMGRTRIELGRARELPVAVACFVLFIPAMFATPHPPTTRNPLGSWVGRRRCFCLGAIWGIFLGCQGAAGENAAVENRAPSITLIAAPRSGPVPLQVIFTADARDPDGDPLTYVWDFGDGSAGSLDPIVAHTYRFAERFTARVTVTDPSGASAEARAELRAMEPGAVVLSTPPVAME